MNKHIRNAKTAYVDANVIIYLLEHNEEFGEKTLNLFEFGEDHGITFITSEIGMAECLFGAHKMGSDQLVKQYEKFFYEIAAVRLLPVEREILETTARIGAKQRLKFVDAIHVASALEFGCDVFITNDTGIKSMDRLPVVLIADL